MNSEIKIYPSIMCADHSNLAEEITKLEKAGIDSYHLDVMDGEYVPNFGCGPGMFKCIKKHSSLPLDVHLMIKDPIRHIWYFRDLGADKITIHPEAGRHPARTLSVIAETGASAGIAINPGEAIETVKELFPLCEHVLVMTVNPGFAGQGFLDFTVDKIRSLSKYADKYGFTICVDGGVNLEKICQLKPLGVSAFVLGAYLFSAVDYGEALDGIYRRMRDL